MRSGIIAVNYKSKNQTTKKEVSTIILHQHSIQGTSLSELSPKDHKFDITKASSLTLAQYYLDANEVRLSERMGNCANYLKFGLGESKNNLGEKVHRLRDARFCQLRFCPTCTRLKARVIKNKFKKAIPLIDKDTPNLRYIFITFTVKNVEMKELKSTIKMMTTGFSRMSKLKVFPTNNFIRVLEISKGTIGGKCHPHLHCILAVDESYFDRKYDYYLTKDKWSSMWKKSCRLNYEPIVDVRVVKGDVRNIAPEILKYTCKPMELLGDKKYLLQLTQQMKNVQTISTSGLFKRYISIIENEQQDLITTDDSPAIEDEYQLLYRFHRRYKKYYLYQPEIEVNIPIPIPPGYNYEFLPY